MNTIGDRIKARRKQLGMTLREAATKADSTASTFRRWEEGDIGSIKTSKLEEIAQALKVSPSYLMGWEALDPIQYPGVQPLDTLTREIPILGEVSAGHGVVVNREYQATVTTPENLKAAFAVRVRGDSMINARIYDGDVVFIRQQDQVETGEIAAVVIEDEVVLKRVYYYEKRLELRSENPTYPPINFEGGAP